MFIDCRPPCSRSAVPCAFRVPPPMRPSTWFSLTRSRSKNTSPFTFVRVVKKPLRLKDAFARCARPRRSGICGVPASRTSTLTDPAEDQSTVENNARSALPLTSRLRGACWAKAIVPATFISVFSPVRVTPVSVNRSRLKSNVNGFVVSNGTF